MIKGIGTDIVRISRVTDLIDKETFMSLTYTEAEQGLLDVRRARAAGEWAAKEAVAKALGTGFKGIALTEIEVLRDANGKPTVTLTGGARQRMEELGATEVLVSITDERDYAAAVAIVQ